MAISKELEDKLVACKNNIKITGKTFFPERFHRPFEPIHQQLIDKIAKKKKSRFTAIAAPRGIGKTSILNFLKTAQSILFQEKRFIVPVSATSDAALLQADNLKMNLVQNREIAELLGDIRSDRFSKEMSVFNILGKEIGYLPRGAGQQVRGMLFKDYRPDLILVDDLEDKETVNSEERRKRQKEWFYSDLLGCVDQADPNWEVIVVGTVLHENSLLVQLLEDPEWDSIRLELCDDNFVSNAPIAYPGDAVQKIYQRYVNAGEEDAFFREYRNLPTSNKSKPFRREDFKYYSEAEHNLSFNKDVVNIVIVDPARTENPSSADSAIVSVGIDTRKMHIYLRDTFSDKVDPLTLYKSVASAVRKHNAIAIGIEVTGLHGFITYPLKEFLTREGLGQVEIIELHARGGRDEKGKIQRIKSLIPYYRGGQIFHNDNKLVHQKLEGQLMGFPRAKLWDLMDVFGYTIEMLDEGEIFSLNFSSEGEKSEDIEKEFRSLDREYYEDGFNMQMGQLV